MLPFLLHRAVFFPLFTLCDRIRKRISDQFIMKKKARTTDQIHTEEKKRKGSPRQIRGWVILLLSAVLLGLLVTAFIIDWQSVSIHMHGDAENWIEYKTAFEDPGADAVFSGRFLRDPIPLKVRTSGEVDAGALGSYTIVYRANFLFFAAKEKRIIHVVDTTAPVIELVTDENTFTLPGEVYEEEGFTAFDNVDGDITDKVKRHEENGIITYTVTDSSFNRTSVERIINYTDPLPPQLTLLGGDKISVEPGVAYEDPGFIAVDNLDGDISDKVTVSGHVDPFVPGDYEITYTIEDSFHNTATATRTVTVNMIQQEADDPDGKYIYLTFDDGPGQYTEQLLDVLKKYNVKATFFVVNTGYADLITREYEEGHSIGIHSATHDYHQIYASEDAYFSDLYRMDEIIYAKTGIHTNIIRFPGGSSNTVSSFNPGIMTRLTQSVKEKGYQYFDWNVSSGDAGGTTSTDQVFQNVINGVQDHTYSVVLMHDIKGFSVDAVERIIVWGLTNGYTFRALDSGSPAAHHNVNN